MTVFFNSRSKFTQLGQDSEESKQNLLYSMQKRVWDWAWQEEGCGGTVETGSPWCGMKAHPSKSKVSFVLQRDTSTQSKIAVTELAWAYPGMSTIIISFP